MKLIRIGNNANTYINVDFLARIWKEGSQCYCELLNKSSYHIDEDAYVKILEYDKKTS